MVAQMSMYYSLPGFGFRNYMNDSLRTDVFVRFQPESIACACIYLAARTLEIPLPNRPHWFLLFGATEEEIQEICFKILQLYTRKKVPLYVFVFVMYLCLDRSIWF